MSENVFVVTFNVESEAYQAMAELKNSALTDDYVISQAYLVKNEGGKIAVKDTFDTGVETLNDTGAGALLGALVGIIGGPVGILLGASYGLLVGSTMDLMDATDNSLLINQVAGSIVEGENALLILASETNEGSLEQAAGKFSAKTAKFDAAEVAAEVEKAEEIERQLRKEAREKMIEEKKSETKAKIDEYKAKLASDFEELKKKLS